MGNLEKQVMRTAEVKSLFLNMNYEYDDMGNRVKVTSDNDQQMIITKRTITYYEK